MSYTYLRKPTQFNRSLPKFGLGQNLDDFHTSPNRMPTLRPRWLSSRGVGYGHGTRCAPGALELTAIGPGKCRRRPKCLLACNGDVSPSGADEPNSPLLSGLDADGSAWVPRVRHRVALTATSPSCRGPGRRFTCIPILSWLNFCVKIYSRVTCLATWA